MFTQERAAGVPAILIRVAHPSDVDGIVRCHTAAFPEGMLTLLGPRLLAANYRFHFERSGSICLVATDDNGKVLGFCVGGKPGATDEFLHKAVRRHFLVIGWKSLVHGVVRKRVVTELLQRMRITRRPTEPPNPRWEAVWRSKNIGGLASIGVLPETQGTGVAGSLIEGFREVGVEQGLAYLYLTVRSDNARAIAFYKKHGWSELGTFGSNSRLGLSLSKGMSATGSAPDEAE